VIYKLKKHFLKPKQRLFGGFHLIHCPRPFLSSFINIYLIDEMDGDEEFHLLWMKKKLS
jgi:hypothetical protein